jgi:hypothetical protein
MGPNLRFPHSSGISSSVGGEKTGDDRWYARFVPIADKIYDAHLEGLRKEGKI